MSWVGIANNQTVSFNNLQDAVTNGYFVALTGIPASQEQITKSDASTYVNLDTAYAPFAAKASNQLVVKSNLRPISYAYTIYYEEACYYDGFYIEGGAATADIACGNTLTITLYSPSSSFVAGMKLFYDAACSNFWYGDTGGCGDYYKVIIAGTTYSFMYPDASSTVSNINTCTVACSCFLLTNTDNIDISISFYDCGGSTINPECNTCAASSQIYLCVQDGQHTNYFVSYGTNCAGGATPSYTFTALGTTCTDSGDCI
jgi:hypothetical protein